VRVINLICLILLIFIPLFSDDFEDYKLDEKQQFEGSKIFDEMVQRLGNVKSMKTIRTIGTASQPTEFGTKSFPVQVEVQFPGKLRIKFEDKEFLIDQKTGWLKYPEGYYENLPDSYIKTVSGNLNRNLLQIAKNKQDFKITALGTKIILNRECVELELEKNDYKFTILIDDKTKLPLQMIYDVNSKQIVRTYQKFELIEGINYPVHTISTDMDGNLISEIEIEEVEFNIKLEGF